MTRFVVLKMYKLVRNERVHSTCTTFNIIRVYFNNWRVEWPFVCKILTLIAFKLKGSNLLIAAANNGQRVEVKHEVENCHSVLILCT